MALKPDASSVHKDVSPPVAASTPAAPSSDVTTAPLKASIISVKVPALPLSPPLDDDDNDNDNGNDEEGGNNSDSDGGGAGGVIASHAHETLLLEAMEAQGSRGVVLPCDSPSGRGDDSRVASSSATTPSSSNGDLLPTTVTPTHYDIHLRPDLATGIVSGSVSVDARINEATDKIVLHAKSITITRVVVYHGGSQLGCVGGDSVVYDNSELEMATIQMPCALQPTKAGDCVQIIITFSGVLSESMYGLYRCKYRDRKGSPSVMLVTQFQAKCARLAFPCWDEPAIKAEFTLALTVPASHTALSNMPVVQETEGPGGAGSKTVFFARSPRMSTYLLAIVSGELDYVEATALSGEPVPNSDPPRRAAVPCRVYTAAADIDKVRFSLETAVRVLELLVDMFGCAYPLPKLDLVAVPELEAGGMENWGLVLFRTVRLFITAQTSLWIRQKAAHCRQGRTGASNGLCT
ncbi:hypothetical protein GGF38_000104 [Coemansia sp. RSA 25]|nr:hypothetical protein GGF38_000104 [Coemansia sp. RSA 25]